MRSKAPLLLMEQMVMLLVFALAAALCLQAFVKSDAVSRRSGDRDRAVVLCQSAAEAIRHSQGNLEEAAVLLGCQYGAYAQEEPGFSVHYNGDWTLSNTREYAFVLRAEPVDSGVERLGKAVVRAVDAADQTVIFEIEVAWQEGEGDGR